MRATWWHSKQSLHGNLLHMSIVMPTALKDQYLYFREWRKGLRDELSLQKPSRSHSLLGAWLVRLFLSLSNPSSQEFRHQEVRVSEWTLEAASQFEVWVEISQFGFVFCFVNSWIRLLQHRYFFPAILKIKKKTTLFFFREPIGHIVDAKSSSRGGSPEFLDFFQRFTKSSLPWSTLLCRVFFVVFL